MTRRIAIRMKNMRSLNQDKLWLTIRPTSRSFLQAKAALPWVKIETFVTEEWKGRIQYRASPRIEKRRREAKGRRMKREERIDTDDLSMGGIEYKNSQMESDKIEGTEYSSIVSGPILTLDLNLIPSHGSVPYLSRAATTITLLISTHPSHTTHSQLSPYSPSHHPTSHPNQTLRDVLMMIFPCWLTSVKAVNQIHVIDTMPYYAGLPSHSVGWPGEATSPD